MSPPRTRQPVQTESPPRAFRNRIVGNGEEAPAQLLANPKNWRIHPQAQQDVLLGVLEQVGWVQDVIVNRQTGYVVDGHLRVALAISKGEPKVPVKYVDLTPEEEALVITTLDPIAAMASADKVQLEVLLRGLEGEDGALRDLLDSLALEQGIDLYGEPPTDPGAQMDLAAELQKKWGTERGQVWQVGDHRVTCGDSTAEADVGRLMAGEAARLMLTDPPYGVAYDTEGRNPHWRKDGRPIANDDLGTDQAAFWTDAFRHWPLEGDAYVFSPSGPLITTLCASIEAAGIAHHQWLIWVKDRFVLSRSHYHYRHEHIWYGWRGKSSWNGSRTEDSVWNQDRPATSPDHPTMKPVELCDRAISNSSKPGDVVADPFLGSGTTLVACERLRRRGRGMEIDAGYVAVTLERLAGMGLEPVLETVTLEA